MTAGDALSDQAHDFAAEITELLRATFREAPSALAEISGSRAVVRTDGPVPLFIKGQERATLKIRLQCQLDSRGTWLAVEASGITITSTVDRTPVFRFEYVRKPKSVPSAHLQTHAHRGALSELLAHAEHPDAHDMSALHIPLGGSRFRPCLEDVVEFIARELQCDVLEGWEEAVNDGRRRWRERQVRAVVRDWQGDAVAALRDLGYSVEPPAGGLPESPWKAMHGW